MPQWLGAAGYDAAFGARPLARAVQRSLLAPIAHVVLSGDVRAGDAVRLVVPKPGAPADARPLLEPHAPPSTPALLFTVGRQPTTDDAAAATAHRMKQ